MPTDKSYCSREHSSMKQRRQGLLSWDLQLLLVPTPVPIPDMLGGSYLLVLALLSGLVQWGVDLRFVLHLICSLMQQTLPAASPGRIKRASQLYVSSGGTRVPSPFFPLSELLQGTPYLCYNLAVHTVCAEEPNTAWT